MSEEPDNSPAAIDKRIDDMVAWGRMREHPPELLMLFDRVYRPFCHAMVELEGSGMNPTAAAHVTALLCANLVKEVSVMTSPFPMEAEKALVKKIGEILRYAKRGQSQLDA